MYSAADTSHTSSPNDGRKVDQILAVVSGTGDSPAAAVQNLIDSANARADLAIGNYIVSLDEDADLHATWQAVGLAVVVS